MNADNTTSGSATGGFPGHTHQTSVYPPKNWSTHWPITSHLMTGVVFLKLWTHFRPLFLFLPFSSPPSFHPFSPFSPIPSSSYTFLIPLLSPLPVSPPLRSLSLFPSSSFLPSFVPPSHLRSRLLKSSLGDLGSAVSSPSGVWGGAPAEVEFGAVSL